MRNLPNLTYWLFGGYIAWLLVSGEYKNMLALVDTSGWKTTTGPSAQANAALTPTAQASLAKSNGMYSGGGLGTGPGGYTNSTSASTAK